MFRAKIDISMPIDKKKTAPRPMATTAPPTAAGVIAATRVPKTSSNASVASGNAMISPRRRSLSLAMLMSL